MVKISQLSVSIVIPAHNEEENIEKAVQHIIPVLNRTSLISSFELILVDDNSRDNTGEIIDRLARDDSHIRAVHRNTAPGFGNAVKTGLAAASNEVVVPVMGDLSDDPEDIIRLVEKISEGYDIAYGSRFIEGGELHGYPWQKLIANRLFNNSLRLSFGVPHRDITNAFKAYRKKVLDEIGVMNLESTGFDLTIEIAMKAHIAGFSSVEVPVRWYDRTAGEAKLKLSRNASVYGKRLIKLFIWGNIVSLRDLFTSVLKGSILGVIGSVIIGLCILSVLFSVSGWGKIFDSVSHISPTWFFGALSLLLITFIVRTWRWSIIFRSSGYVVDRDILFKAIMFGWFINYLVPARLGDISRSLAIKITTDKPLGVTLGTIVIERIFDTLTLTVLLVGISFLLPQFSYFIIEAISLTLTAFLVMLLGIVYYYPHFLRKRLQFRFPKFSQSLILIQEGLKAISKNPFGLILSFILSCIIWIIDLSVLYVSARSIGINPNPLVIAIAGIVSFILQSFPLTPAGLGVHEISIAGVLQFFSIPSATGTAIALVDHFARALIVYILGIMCTIHIGFSARKYFRNNLKDEE